MRKKLISFFRRNKLNKIKQAAKKLEVGYLIDEPGERNGADVYDLQPGRSRPRLFGFYSAAGVQYALREMGVLDVIESKGYGDLRVSLTGDRWGQSLSIYGTAADAEHLVVEGRYKRTPWNMPDNDCFSRRPKKEELAVIIIEWLLLQNPVATFTKTRPRLPGQDHPGLGMKEEVLDVFSAVGDRLNLDAYVANAKFFHNALMYKPEFVFIDPMRQAEFIAIQKAAGDAALQDIAAAMESGHLYRLIPGEKTGPEPFTWTGAQMIHPISDKAKTILKDCQYLKIVENSVDRIIFRFDWESYFTNKTKIMNNIFEMQKREPDAVY